MASLIDELIEVLEKENEEYQELYALSTEKTTYIVKGEVDNLQRLVEKEQIVVDRVSALEKRRTAVVTDIANVLNVPREELTVRKLIVLLKGQENERNRLESIYNKLRKTLDRVVKSNDGNTRLINESLEMIQFEINLAQSVKSQPETANYTKNAYGAANAYTSKGFDAKQ